MINGQVHALSQLFGDEHLLTQPWASSRRCTWMGVGFSYLFWQYLSRPRYGCRNATCFFREQHRAVAVPDQALRKALEVKACQWGDVNVLAQGCTRTQKQIHGDALSASFPSGI